MALLVAAGCRQAQQPPGPTPAAPKLEKGIRLTLRAKTEEFTGKEWTAEELDRLRLVVEKRAKACWGWNAVVTSTMPDTITVEMRYQWDPARLPVETQGKMLLPEEKIATYLVTPGHLDFYVLRQLGSEELGEPATWALTRQINPKTKQEEWGLIDKATLQPISKERLETEVFSRPPIVSDKDMVNNSRVEIQRTNNQPVIAFEFQGDGARIFEDATRTHLHRHLAIFLDKKLLTPPIINAPLPGKGIIEGGFTLESAKTLSDQLNAGELPAPLELKETSRLEASPRP